MKVATNRVPRRAAQIITTGEHAHGVLSGVLRLGMQTTFSQRGIQERGDTRGWTETPQQKLLRLSAAATEQLAAPPEDAAAQAKARASGGAVDAYNAAHRGRTLLEQHQQRLQARMPMP